MVDPEVGAKIYPWVFWKHKRYTGVEAAKLLTDRQLQGLEMLTERRLGELHHEDHPHNCGVYEYRWNSVNWSYDLERCNEIFY